MVFGPIFLLVNECYIILKFGIQTCFINTHFRLSYDSMICRIAADRMSRYVSRFRSPKSFATAAIDLRPMNTYNTLLSRCRQRQERIWEKCQRNRPKRYVSRANEAKLKIQTKYIEPADTHYLLFKRICTFCETERIICKFEKK